MSSRWVRVRCDRHRSGKVRHLSGAFKQIYSWIVGLHFLSSRVCNYLFYSFWFKELTDSTFRAFLGKSPCSCGLVQVAQAQAKDNRTKTRLQQQSASQSQINSSAALSRVCALLRGSKVMMPFHLSSGDVSYV